MPQREQYVPKHRGAAPEAALKKSIKKSVMFSGVAVAATGIAVSSGIVMKGGGSTDSASAALAAAMSNHKNNQAQEQQRLADRVQQVSRSDHRHSIDPTKASALNQDSGGQATKTEDLTSQDPRTIAQALLPQFGFDASQFSCLDSLYMRESGWNIHATNASSGAYGIPQALPASKMASAGPDWQNNAETQIRWGLQYIQSRYGTPCGAWAHETAIGWY